MNLRSVTVLEHHIAVVLSFYSYCYSSYYFLISHDFDYFDSFVLSWTNLLHDQIIAFLIWSLVSSDVYRLELEQRQQLVCMAQWPAPVQVLSLLVLLPFRLLILVLLCSLFVAIFTSARTQHVVQLSVLLRAEINFGAWVVHHVFDLVGYCDDQILDFVVHFALWSLISIVTISFWLSLAIAFWTSYLDTVQLALCTSSRSALKLRLFWFNSWCYCFCLSCLFFLTGAASFSLRQPLS